MNREIKFRAWDEKKRFLHSPRTLSELMSGGFYWEGKNVMQFTGLKDKNGKEIYEGDVVEIRKDGNIFDNASRVIFSQYGGFQFYDMTFQDVFRDSNYDVRIIGNVFENPSLLK